MQLSLSLEQLLHDAWSGVRKNKALVWFGLLAATGGSGAAANYSSSISDGMSDVVSAEELAFIALIIGVCIVIAFVVVILSIISSLSLAKGVDQQIKGETSGFKAALTVKGFWRYVGATIILTLIGIASLFVALLHIVLVAASGIGLLLLPFVVLVVIFGFITLGLSNYALVVFTASNVVKGLGPIEAVREAVLLLWRKPLDVFVVSAIISTMHAIIIGIVALLIFVVGFGVGISSFLAIESNPDMLIAFIVVIGIFAFFAALIYGLLRAILVTFGYQVLHRAWFQLTK